MVMLWNVGLYYYAGDATTPEGQIPDIAREFDTVVLLSSDEGASYDLGALLGRIMDFWNDQSNVQILVEIPNPGGTGTYPFMKARLDEIESQAGGMVKGYYFVPKESNSIWNGTATDSSHCRDNARDIVRDVKALSKYALWMPAYNPMSYDMMDQCQLHISFTNILPNFFAAGSGILVEKETLLGRKRRAAS
ncbi:MAG TPA: hypothetical protein PLC12_04415 [Candidatus Methanofastidiosa archaeon]|nr:hypothetical protein [Candidatus Methanofastidiosa archaeon]